MTVIQTDLRTNSAPARRVPFEQSATFPATNTQDAINSIATGFLPNAPVTPPVTASGNIAASDVNVQTMQSAPITLVVPLSTAWAAASGKYGLPLSIFDGSGTAATNPVTINFTGGETVSGLSSRTIATNFGGYRLRPKTGGGWIQV